MAEFGTKQTEYCGQYYTFFFYKNTFYKNIQAEIPEKIRTFCGWNPCTILWRFWDVPEVMRRCLRRCETFSETVPSHHRLIAGPLEMMIGTSLIPFVFSLGCYDRLMTQFQLSRSKTYITCNPICAKTSISDSYSIRTEPCCSNYCLTVEAQIIVSHG